ncbi:hypothetical protein BSKO_13475 [Bryopsis sp. KO-2023]|nr:hypothetical protein BSKO_13475 [Bryopsis sp. KO-2023]
MASAMSLFPGGNETPALSLDYCGVLRAWERMGGEIDPLDKITLENAENADVPQIEMPPIDLLVDDPYFSQQLLPTEQMLADASLDLMSIPMDLRVEPLQYMPTMKEENCITNVTGAMSDTHSNTSSFISEMIPQLDAHFLGTNCVANTLRGGVPTETVSSLTPASMTGVEPTFAEEKCFSSVSDLARLPLVGNGPAPFSHGSVCDPVSISTIDTSFQLGGGENRFVSSRGAAGAFSSGPISPPANPPAFLSGPSLPGKSTAPGYNSVMPKSYSPARLPVPVLSSAPMPSYIGQSGPPVQQPQPQQHAPAAQSFAPSQTYCTAKLPHRTQSRKQMSFAAQVNAVNGVKGQFRTRQQCLERYLEKKARRLQTKKIRYELRKINADRRPRIKGRFVKKEQLEEYLKNQQQAKVEC